MRVLNNKFKLVLIMTSDKGDSPTCPRIIVSKGKTYLRDDYMGRLKISSKLCKRI